MALFSDFSGAFKDAHFWLPESAGGTELVLKERARSNAAKEYVDVTREVCII
jgi:hypothetical protein